MNNVILLGFEGAQVQFNLDGWINATLPELARTTTFAGLFMNACPSLYLLSG